jgi:hypothetical protein
VGTKIAFMAVPTPSMRAWTTLCGYSSVSKSYAGSIHLSQTTN